MNNPPLPSRGFFAAAGLASLALSSTNARAQTQIADSQAEFSGIQGQDDWTYGYRNLTADAGTRDAYAPDTDFIPFAGGSDNPDPFDGTTQQWTGTAWDLSSSGAPWTNLQAYNGHPNGINNAAEHWTIRRWTAPGTNIAGPTVVRIDWRLAKTAAGGSGTTAQLHKNGTRVAIVSAQGTDGVTETQVNTTSYLTVDVGDRLDLALTPVGIDLSTHDGNDTSATRMVITTAVDSDGDGLADAWEERYFPGDLTQLSSGGDKDGDGLADEDEQTVASNPTASDTDGDGVGDADDAIPTDPNSHSDADGYNDSVEQAANSDPLDGGDTPVSMLLTDSRTAWTASAGGQGVGGWSWGYRNLTTDGGGTDYDPSTAFIPFPTDGTTTLSATNFWNGGAFDWPTGNPPWTFMTQEGVHPNGTNHVEPAPGNQEHWAVRRWTVSGVGAAETPVSVFWHTRKTTLGGNGVTGSIHLNGVRADSMSIAGADGTGFQHRYYLHLKDGDQLDLMLTPENPNGTRDDGSDGSANWMRIDARILTIPVQPDGSYFIPNNSMDSDTDSLADFWEEVYFPGDLTKLAGGGDFDHDGALDGEEMAAGTDPTDPDMDGDGLTDGEEAVAGTNPQSADTDGDDFGDRHELSTGYDPLDANDNVFWSLDLRADSQIDFPTGEPSPQGGLGWTHGYYDVSAGGEPPLNTTFIPFPTDGTTSWSETNFWTGTVFDWFNGNPPWTQLAEVEGHPSSATGMVQWVSRRWEVGATGPLALTYHLRKANVGGGNGTSVLLLHNGRELDRLAVGGTDGIGITSWVFINARAGDTVELVLTPKGPDGVSSDGYDATNYWLVADGNIPARPLQPDGSLFVVGGAATLGIVSVDYDAAPGNLTIRWVSSDTRSYQIEEWDGNAPVTWTPIGPVIPGAAGETQHTLNGIFGARRLFHVVELAP